MASKVDRVPDYILERYAAEELPQPETETLGRRLEREPRLAERLAELHASNEEILHRYPAGAFMASIEPPKRSLWVQPRFLAPALAAAAVMMIIWAGPQILPGPVPTERVKGLQPQLRIYRQAAQGADNLEAGALAGQHDLLQISYIAAGAAHGVILSVDGRGVVTLHFPDTVDGTTELDQGGETAISFAYELDDAPDYECFFLVTSESPLAVEEILEAAQRFEVDEQVLTVPSNCEQHGIAINKRETSR